MKQLMLNSIKRNAKVSFFASCLSLFFISSTSYAIPNGEGIQVYQQHIHLSPERKQGLAEDVSRYRNADDLWNVLRREFSLPHYEENYLVQEQINWFMTHQEFLVRATSHAAPYLYYILQQARKRHLPVEVVLLPVFESSFNPFAYSSAGAAGIWQMMPNTATGYGVKQDWWYDGRRDVITSTKAALNYLAYLSNFFDGNWLFAIAAYDTGEGNVLSAIRKNINSGLEANYWSLPLAQETRTYVPRLLALATIIAHPEKYPVYLPPVHNAPYLAQMDVGTQVDLHHAASLAGLTLKALMQLNPGYNRSTTSPHGPSKLVLPIENVAQFSENLERSPLSQHVTWQHYIAKNGESLATVAKHHNVSVAMLRQMNQLKGNYIKPGSSLVIPHTTSNPEMYAATNHKNESLNDVSKIKPSRLMASLEKMDSHYSLQPGDTIYMVRSGDNFSTISQRFHLSERNIQAANPFPANKRLNPGDRLVIPTHIRVAEEKLTQKYQLTSGDTIYMVRQGDTIEKIAEKFHTSPPAIRVANLLASNDLRDGDRLVIPTHL
ncbi:MAG: LysM peptidoglycan-binding domain-containing protein [Gammaproteobacteria bacterium]|nr:LysM peptidoglycan-binding domain-containing protein [Gammaproteobacteria bacterium]